MQNFCIYANTICYNLTAIWHSLDPRWANTHSSNVVLLFDYHTTDIK